jgi:hypothetical protein
MRTITVEEEHLKEVSDPVAGRRHIDFQKPTSNWSTKASIAALSPVKYLGCDILLVTAEKKSLG